jgi:hypothetical protein
MPVFHAGRILGFATGLGRGEVELGPLTLNSLAPVPAQANNSVVSVITENSVPFLKA